MFTQVMTACCRLTSHEVLQVRQTQRHHSQCEYVVTEDIWDMFVPKMVSHCLLLCKYAKFRLTSLVVGGCEFSHQRPTQYDVHPLSGMTRRSSQFLLTP